jgi:Zn-dependent peptidase ImmA (M78 family)
VPFRLAALEETFWHELTHAILHDMGEHQLNNRESFVEEFANRLARAIQTARF